ncbi:Enamine deaminase RidA, house cleaning of reactive enamine intermediates, YjgF/YER057c/UK114 family [Roseovarius lutimaris]|uniref:Enamine deaminase RidA, house cleaning of reactive enamine intermediates, YjgF/YER057c/UK114 family n=1 Tax=Roseovarius lutimaris TaxID=1005928 RepID=A0A1I5GX14_9RHOB|nr:Rid family hydrolase [Roseovarius lutimaris]SFO40487.1 Enamine deaminase RidA, house cleaning of reactive enamine intermediates, YjgF/YER057c/UK114 family [Roseovarius lutimaris]
MRTIRRIAGQSKGRSSGTVVGGFAWAVATSEIETDDFYQQTVSTLQKIDRILAEMDTDKSRAVTATVYITDITHKDDMDRAWCEWVGDNPDNWPQRACVQTGLHATDLVEVVVMAAL